MCEAEIALIPKLGKDPSSCTSYYPITLQNTDLKLYTKILMVQLDHLISGLIDPDQVGFIHNQQG